MNTYILKSSYGIAVINADTPADALKMLVRQEESDDCICLSHGATEQDFTLITKAQGMVAYFATG